MTGGRPRVWLRYGTIVMVAGALLVEAVAMGRAVLPPLEWTVRARHWPPDRGNREGCPIGATE